MVSLLEKNSRLISKMKIFFVPGLFGSKIKCNLTGRKIFPPQFHECVFRTKMQRITQIESTDVAYGVLMTIFGRSVYSILLKQRLKNAIPLPYDWRCPLKAVETVLGSLKYHLTTTDGDSEPITFVCHSFGGILVHELLNRADEFCAALRKRVHLVIMVATPILGSTLLADILRKKPRNRDMSVAKINIIPHKALNAILLQREQVFKSFLTGKNLITYNCVCINNKCKKTPIIINEWTMYEQDVSYYDMWRSDRYTYIGKGRWRLHDEIEYDVKGDGVVPAIPPYQFKYQNNCIAYSLMTKKSHAFLLNSKKILIAIEMFTKFAEKFTPDDVNLNTVFRNCFENEHRFQIIQM